MNRGVYAASAGMAASQRWLDAIAQDLANVETNGYKRSSISFGATFERTLKGSTGREIGALSPGPAEMSRALVWERGPVTFTGNDLDLAISQDRGLFAVQTPQGVRYTRDGAFQLNGQRQIVTKAGYPVLNAALRPIELREGDRIRIDQAGLVSVDGVEAGRIALFDGRFEPSGRNLFTGTGEAVGEPQLAPQSIERSNVSPIEAMISMIRLNRQFEMAQRTISAEDEASQRLIQSLQA
jgi:flagellar basal body rod protein FlgG